MSPQITSNLIDFFLQLVPINNDKHQVPRADDPLCGESTGQYYGKCFLLWHCRAISWTSVEWAIWHHMASAGANELSREFNSLSPGRYEWSWRLIIFNAIFKDLWLRYLLWKLPSDECHWTLLQVMACFCQATSHYLGQYQPWFMPLYDITRPQWVNCSTLCLLCFAQTWHWLYIAWWDWVILQTPCYMQHKTVSFI